MLDRRRYHLVQQETTQLVAKPCSSETVLFPDIFLLNERKEAIRIAKQNFILGINGEIRLSSGKAVDLTEIEVQEIERMIEFDKEHFRADIKNVLDLKPGEVLFSNLPLVSQRKYAIKAARESSFFGTSEIGFKIFVSPKEFGCKTAKIIVFTREEVEVLGLC